MLKFMTKGVYMGARLSHNIENNTDGYYKG